jgi:transposase
MAEGFISDDTVAIDATHIEARDQAPAKQRKKNLSRKSALASLKKSVKPG